MTHSRPDPDAAPSGAWIALFLGVGAFLRFAKLSTLSVWPLVDESVHGWIAHDWMTRWDGRLFHYVSQMPPLYFALQAAVFKAMGVGLTSLWFLPALLSWLTCVAAVCVARARHYPPVFQWAGVVMALSFWPAYLGRFSHPAVLVPLLEIIGVALLVEWKKCGERSGWAAALGALVGFGFYTYLAWPVVALSLGLGVVMLAGPKTRWRSLAVLVATAAVVAAPLAWEAFRLGFGSYYQHLWSVGKGGVSLRGTLGSIGEYIRVLWIGTDRWHFFYTPAWGGLWNPVVGLGVLLGLAGTLHRRKSAFARWALLCGVLFLLPGILTVSLNPLRIVAWVPLGAALAAIGWWDVLSRVSRRARVFGLVVLLVGSTGWDAYHLFNRYPLFWREGSDAWGEMSKSWKFKKAGDVVSKETREWGPGVLLASFQLEPVDQSLALTAASWGKTGKRDQGECRWIAFIANVNYGPFLATRFEGLRSYPLPKGADREAETSLYFVPVPTDGEAPWVRSFQETEAAWGRAVSEGFLRPEGGSYASVLRRFEESRDVLRGDPLLESLLGEKMALIHALDSAYGTRDKRGNFLGSFQALQRAVEKGYPAAHLWNELGSLYALAGKKTEAKACFNKALAAPLNKTNADENLRVLRSRE